MTGLLKKQGWVSKPSLMVPCIRARGVQAVLATLGNTFCGPYACCTVHYLSDAAAAGIPCVWYLWHCRVWLPQEAWLRLDWGWPIRVLQMVPGGPAAGSQVAYSCQSGPC